MFSLVSANQISATKNPTTCSFSPRRVLPPWPPAAGALAGRWCLAWYLQPLNLAHFSEKIRYQPWQKKTIIYIYIHICCEDPGLFFGFDFNIYKKTYLLIFVTIPSKNQGTHLVLRVLWATSSSPLVKGS